MMQAGYEKKRWWERQICKQEMQDGSGSVVEERCEQEMCG